MGLLCPKYEGIEGEELLHCDVHELVLVSEEGEKSSDRLRFIVMATSAFCVQTM